MKRTTSLTFTLATAVLALGPAVLTAGSAAQASAHGRAGRDGLQRDLDALRAAGVTGAFAELRTPRGSTTARTGVADLESRRPVPPNARFRIGSTTKTYTAVVVLQLVAEGRISLEDTVDRWLPGVVAGNGHDGRKITVRQLLRHNSGIAEYVYDVPMYKAALAEGYKGFLRERFRIHQPREFVAMAMRHRPLWVPTGPGERRWSYSNTNYVLAGMLIERVTGRSWEREVRDRITRPLGLRHTGLTKDSRTFPRPHVTAYQQFLGDDRLYDVTLTADRSADGGFVSTTGEVLRFFRALLRGRLLPPAQMAEMMKTVPANDPGETPGAGARYGLGLEWYPLTCGGGYWFHGGDSLGVSHRGGVTRDGRRSVSVAISTEFLDRQRETAKDRVADRLVDRALCGTKR